MNKKTWTLIFAAALSACGKEEPPAPLPELAPPADSRPAPGNDGRSAARPEAEVTASSGPIQLTFGLLKTRIKAETPLWYRLEIKNLGKEAFLLDDAMRHPGNMGVHVARPKIKPFGLYVQVTDDKGNLVNSRLIEAGIPECMPEQRRSAQEEVGWEIQDLLTRFEKEGLSREEQDRKVSEFLRERRRKAESEMPPRKFHLLGPGQTAATPPWVYRLQCDDYSGKPLRVPLGGFTELPQYLYWPAEPGKFKIRVGYNHAIPPGAAVLRDPNFRRTPEYVAFETPPVDFEVVP